MALIQSQTESADRIFQPDELTWQGDPIPAEAAIMVQSDSNSSFASHLSSLASAQMEFPHNLNSWLEDTMSAGVAPASVSGIAPSTLAFYDDHLEPFYHPNGEMVELTQTQTETEEWEMFLAR